MNQTDPFNVKCGDQTPDFQTKAPKKTKYFPIFDIDNKICFRNQRIKQQGFPQNFQELSEKKDKVSSLKQ